MTGLQFLEERKGREGKGRLATNAATSESNRIIVIVGVYRSVIRVELSSRISCRIFPSRIFPSRLVSSLVWPLLSIAAAEIFEIFLPLPASCCACCCCSCTLRYAMMSVIEDSSTCRPPDVVSMLLLEAPHATNDRSSTTMILIDSRAIDEHAYAWRRRVVIVIHSICRTCPGRHVVVAQLHDMLQQALQRTRTTLQIDNADRPSDLLVSSPLGHSRQQLPSPNIVWFIWYTRR
jgi:hypothetical protein